MIQPVQRQKKTLSPIQLIGWPLGENTSVPANQLSTKELSECIDFKLNPGGKLEARPPIVAYTDTAIGTPRDAQSCSLAGTRYTICSDEDTIYYFDELTPTAIGTVAGPAQITSYNDMAVIADGSYLKYCDSTSAVKLYYDGGESGTQYDNYSGTDDTTLKAARVAVKFTSQTWTAGFTIPLTKITAKVQADGGTASITGTLRLVSTDVAVATKVYTGVVPSTAAGYIDIVFASTDVTAGILPGTAYYASLEGSNFNVQCTTVASGGVGYTYAPSTWTAVTTKNPIMRVHPGRPPKADWTVVSGNRLRVHDPDRPGGLWYAFGMDLSTTDVAGWQGVSDQNYNSFPVGAAQDLYGSLFVYGTEDQPYIAKWEGATPSAYSILPIFQQSWTTQRTLVNTNNDLFSASASGVDPLTGVQAYGDLRTFSASDRISDRFSNWVSTTAFAGYNAKYGQYWLYMPTYSDYVSVCHTKQKTADENAAQAYPWVRYKLTITPTCFSQVGDTFLIGATDGLFYTLDPDEYKDFTTTKIEPSFGINYIEFPQPFDIERVQFLATSRTGSTFTIDFYKDGAESISIMTKTLSIPVSDTLTLAEVADISLADMFDVTIKASGTPLYFDVNIPCYSIKMVISEIQSLLPVYINGIILFYTE